MEPRGVTHFDSAAAFRRWLRSHHSKRSELWVGYWKKATGRPSLTWEESVDEGLCFGWIDGIRKKVDDESYAVRFTPRRPTSTWSRRNMDRYAELAELDRIAPSGASAFERRTEENTGRYSFEQKDTLTLSAEYLKQLKANAPAWADWQARPPGYRRQVTHWIMSAKRESTRDRRLASLIEDCAAGRKVKPLR